MVLRMATDTLLPLGEVTRRLRILGQSHVGMRTIPINLIVGSVDRAVADDLYLWVHYKLRELRRVHSQLIGDGIDDQFLGASLLAAVTRWERLGLDLHRRQSTGLPFRRP